MMWWKVPVAGVLLWYLWEFLKWGEFFRVIHNQQPGPCHPVEGVYKTKDGGQGSEDVEVLPDGTAIFSSGLNYMRNPVLRDVPGRLMTFHFNRSEEPAKELRIKGYDKKLNPHGLSLWTCSAGKTYVYVINHAMGIHDSDESVEKFLLDLKTLTLTHHRTIKDPSFTSLNDLAVVDEDKFYVTNDYIFRDNWIRRLEYISFLPINDLIFYDGKKGNVAASLLRRPNGIAMSPDGRFLYVGETSARRITSFRVSPDHKLQKVDTKYLGALVDNLNVDAQSGDIWIATHPIGYKIMWKVMFPAGTTSPSLVLRVRVEDGRFLNSTQIYADDGTNLIASGSAAFYKNAVLIGTPTHKLMYCECLTC